MVFISSDTRLFVCICAYVCRSVEPVTAGKCKRGERTRTLVIKLVTKLKKYEIYLVGREFWLDGFAGFSLASKKKVILLVFRRFFGILAFRLSEGPASACTDIFSTNFMMLRLRGSKLFFGGARVDATPAPQSCIKFYSKRVFLY